ncbi:MAG: hydantoinase/oxoprolinase family protein [Lautropia sp.]
MKRIASPGRIRSRAAPRAARPAAPKADRGTFTLAIDIGGTFTDAVLLDEATGQTYTDKVLSTPDDPSLGFISCADRLAARLSLAPDDVGKIIHGTTIATNTLLERKGVRVGFLVTRGFRDILEIGRQIRHELYDLQFEKPAALVERGDCLEVSERIDYLGRVVRPLDEADVVRAAAAFRRSGVASVAICFLHSYRNPEHERRAAQVLAKAMPGVALSVSSDLAPEIREYWRASTAATNAYVAPPVKRYLSALTRRLAERGIPALPQIVQSSGGLMSIEAACDRPVQLLESGPAAGVQAAAYFANLAARSAAIAFDMGGTTAKVGLVEDGRPRIVPEFEAGGVGGTGSGMATASGYPILSPVVDLVEVSAGGGSIAWIDPGGLLRVGPQSAGASPGPACYGRGGTQPTVTDANVVLGRLNPDFFLGGEMALDAQASREAIERACGRPLGLTVEAAALGILRIANARMAEAVRLMTVQRGIDPRSLALVTTGGAGPAHACALADELAIPEVVVPPSPGTGSALGMLVSGLRVERRVSHLGRLGPAFARAARALHAQLRAAVLLEIVRQGAKRAAVRFEHYVELRYLGQSSNLRIETRDGRADGREVDRWLEAFHRQHESLYGYRVDDEPVEMVNVGVVGTAQRSQPSIRSTGAGGASYRSAVKQRRRVYFESGWVDCPVLDRAALRAGNRVPGPAIVEESDATTVVSPGRIATVAANGVVVIGMRRSPVASGRASGRRA